MASDSGKVLGKIEAALSKLNLATQNGGKDTQRGMRGGLKKLDTLIGIERGALQAFSDGAKLQELALTRGTNLGGLLARSADNIENLEKNFTGYGNAIQIAADAFDAGLDTNNKQVGRLLLSNKLTEKGSKQLAKTIRANTIGLGISESGIGHLADTTLKLQQQYGVTSQELQNAIGELGERLTAFGALGIAEEAQKAVMMMAGAIGKGGEKMGASILKAVTAGDKLGQMSALGIQKERQKFLQGHGDTTEAALDLQLAAIKASHNIAQKWTKDSKTPMLMLEAANRTYGGIIIDGNKAAEALFKKYKTHDFEVIKAKIKAENKAAEISDRFTETWDNVKSKILGPLQKMLTGWMIAFLEWTKDPRFDEIVTQLGKLALALGAWVVLKPFLTPLKLIAGGLIKLSVQIMLWIVAMAKSTAKSFMKGFSKKGPQLRNKAGQFMKKSKGGVMGGIKSLASGFLGKFMGFFKLLPMLLVKGLILVPVFGLILVAIIGLVGIFMAFKDNILGFFKPLLTFFKPIYDFFIHGIFQIRKAFSSGIWKGIEAIGALLMKVPIMLWGYLQKLFYMIMKGLSYYEETKEKWQKKIDAHNKANEDLAVVQAGQRKSHYEEQAKLKALQTKELAAKAKDRAAAEKALLKAGTANELLDRIHKSMDLEAMRTEAAQEIREQQLKVQKATEDKLSKPKIEGDKMQ